MVSTVKFEAQQWPPNKQSTIFLILASLRITNKLLLTMQKKKIVQKSNHAHFPIANPKLPKVHETS
jgi:sulfur carrier protein ThiS